MTSNLDERLDQILPKILSEDFLAGKGLGNEIGFWVFDYLPKDELAIRRHLDFLMTQIPKQRPHLRIAHVNLFDLMLGYLKERKLLDKAIEMQQAKGDEALQKALAAPLHGKHIAAFLAKQFPPQELDLMLMSGVGSAFPLLRSHNLLNNLHPVMGDTPLVVFYPGTYDGQSLSLFGQIKQDNYYRAFKLVP
ncbi:DUF1788 domain-containing protein [Holophaga foetida]|uniref:DUF1788 domain-containing protein n=1 Tax=Holophaga foetida TaxID=35839 RepID=UPI0002471739|nr:DUF1788 domain-containing protein [Holophaga foetida]